MGPDDTLAKDTIIFGEDFSICPCNQGREGHCHNRFHYRVKHGKFLTFVRSSVPYTLSTEPAVLSTSWESSRSSTLMIAEIAESKETLSHSDIRWKLLVALGFVINMKKSTLSNMRVGISRFPVEFPQHDNCLADA